MMTAIEHVALGAALLGAAAIGIARGAAYFRRTYTGVDRFHTTSFASVILVALMVGGLFYLINGVAGVDAGWRVPAALTALAFAVVMPVAVWRWTGPKSESGDAKATQ